MWKYFILATLGAGVVCYLQKKKLRTYKSYIDECILYSESLSDKDDEIRSKVIVGVFNGSNIETYLYRRYDNSRVTKLKLPIKPFPIQKAPNEVKKNIEKGEYVMYNFN